MPVRNGPDNIDCVLLYARPVARFDFEAVRRFANTLIDDSGARFEYAQISKPEAGFVLLVGYGVFVQISCVDEPLERHGFVGALDSGFVQAQFPAAAAVVEAHAAYILITVTHKLPMPAELDRMFADLGVENTASPGISLRALFDRKLMLARRIAGFIAERHAPTGVHWLQSNQLLNPEHFVALARDEHPIALHVHPYAFSSTPGHFGFSFVGAEAFTGHKLIFGETDGLAPVDIIARGLSFIEMVQSRGEMFADGDTFGIDQRERIRIRHVPPQNGNDPHVLLLLEPASQDDGEATSHRTARAEPIGAMATQPKMEPIAFRPVAEATDDNGQTGLDSLVAGPPARRPQAITRANAPKAMLPQEPQADGLLTRLRGLLKQR